MSHRRKSARPTNKLNRRTATDSSSVSSDSDADHGKMYVDHCPAGLLADGGILGSSASPSQLEIPSDLWQDFEALLTATNLDAASLMRRLLQQYGRNSAPVDCDLPDVTDECGEEACPDESVENLTYPPPSPSPVDEVLDLSSSGINRSCRSSPTQPNLKSFFHGPDAEHTDADKPLDLTLAKGRRSPDLPAAGEGKKDHVTRVLDAHNFPSDIVTLLSRPGPFLPSSVTSSHLPSLHSSPAHMPGRSSPAHSSTRPTPSHAASHLFAHTIVCSQKYGQDETKTSSEGSPSVNYSPGTDFGSPANHLTSQASLGATPVRQVAKHASLQGGAARGDLHPPRGQTLLPMALHLLSSAPSCASPRHEGCTPRTCTTTSSSGSMQLPTVTSMDFQLDPGQLNPAMLTGCSSSGGNNNNNSGSFGSLVALPQPEAHHSAAAAPIALPASAVYLDTTNGGLVASATGSPGVCVTTVSIPFVTTASGEGVVAIPLLQAPRPEIHPNPSQAQPVAASPTILHSLPSGKPLTFSPSTPTPTSSMSRSLKPKLGRPRGPYAKPQKVAPKDMKLVTENSLFPGVYTSILKLPWSKRSRGKSAKIKDADSAATAAAASTASPTASTSTSTSAVVPQEAQIPASPSAVPASVASSPPRDAAPITTTYLSMPVIIPEHAQSVIVPERAQSQKQQQQAMPPQSVMMVYPNAAMSSLGKAGRRRGRPPKLPVLSHLLTEKRPKKEDPATKAQRLQHEGDMSSQDCSAQRQASASTIASCLSYSSSDVLVPDASRVSENDDGRGKGVASEKYVPSTNVSTSSSTGGGEQRPEEASLETRFNILANQLGLEIGSAYHANLVYATPSARQAVDSALYKEMLMSSRSLVEVKPRRRQLNDLIKPTDDVVFTSFRIRPRGSGRGGAKAKRIRKCRRRGEYGFDGGSDSLDLPTVDGVGDYVTPDAYGGSSSKSSSASMMLASAVITEPVPGAGNMMQRLYQDLYRCQQCDEILPADDTVEHACSSSRASPAGRKCDRCSATLPARHRVEEVGEVTLCDKCLPDSRTLPEVLAPKCSLSPPSSACLSPPPIQAQHSLADAFSCQPCDMQFATIAEYIDHRRRAHLDKLCRQTRKTHSLKTLACPVHTCPRLFHTQAELARHVQDEHDRDPDLHDLELKDKDASGSGGGAPASEVKDRTHLNLASVDDLSSQAGAAASEDYHSSGSRIAGTSPAGQEQLVPQAAASDEEAAACFSCTQEGCQESYASALEVLEHVQAAHQDVRRWQCPWAGCVRQFGAERHLRVHLLIHKDEKPLKCELCDYRCRQRNALNWHMRKHPEAAVHYRKFSNLTPDI